MRKIISSCILFFIVQVFVYADEKISYQLLDKNDQRIFLVDIDPRQYQIVAVKASKEEGNKATVAKLAAEHGALAAVNGGFFHEDGTPAGALKIRDAWLGLVKKPRAAMGWRADGSAILMDRIITKSKNNQIIVQPQLNKTLASKKAWQEFDFVVGGIPLLIKNGKAIHAHSSEAISTFIQNKHARTAMCIKENQHWLFLVASHVKDAARPHVDPIVEGLTIAELQQLLIEQGCQHALNLDGGGSSTLVIDSKTINPYAGDFKPLTQEYTERAVSDAILILPRK